MDVQDIQPAVENLPKVSPFSQICLIPVRGGNDSDIDGDNAVTSDPHDFTLLNCPQELCLELKRKLPDFIQEQSSVMGQFKISGLPILLGSGERPGLIAEQLAFQQGFRYGGTVNSHKWTAFSGAVIVDTLCKQLLAGAALACEQDI